MADVNRHIKWDTIAIIVDIRGSTVVEKGDLMFLDRTDGLRNGGASSANYSAYPFSKIGGVTKTLASNQELAADNFLGVSMYTSDSGTTEPLTIATAGHFKFPLKSSKTFKVGETVMPTGSGTSLFNQKIELWQSGTTYPLGYTERGLTKGFNVTFNLRTAVVGKQITYTPS
jgi:hypothetical protein